MAITSSKYKAIKWIFAIIALLTIILFSASWYVSKQVKPLIKQELKTLIKSSTFGLYNMDYSGVHVNFITGSVTIDNVQITPDTVVYKAQVITQKAPNNLYYISLNKLLLKNIHLFKLYFGKTVKINQILFDNPEVKIVNRHFDFNDNKLPRPEKSPYDYISKFFKSVNVHVIDFKNAKVKYIDNNKTIPELDSVSNITVSLKDWLIDKNSAKDGTRMYLLKDINMYVNNYRYATPDSMYYIKVDQLSLAAKAGKVNIKELILQPRYSQQEFAKVAGYARDRFSIQLNNISLDSLNFPAYIKKREVIANAMNISDGIVSVYNDNTYPKLNTIKTGRFPHQLLQKVNELITIKRINLSKINIGYAQFNKKSQKTGKITFESTSGTIRNVTNAPNFKLKNPSMKADLQTYVMGQGKLNVSFDFNLVSQKGDFSYKGEMVSLDGRKLNQVIKPLGMLQIKKGLIRSLAFDIKADENLAKGRIDFKYNDLSVGLYKKNKDSSGIERMGLLSILANALVVYSDNPSADGKYTFAEVNYQRKPTGSFFNFIWKTLFEGVKYSVGFSPEKEKEIKNKIAEFKQMKQQRMDRKERREKRQERKEFFERKSK